MLPSVTTAPSPSSRTSSPSLAAGNNAVGTKPNNKKRKRAAEVAASPASDSANALLELQLSRYSRPMNTTCRDPTFVPIAEESAFHTTEQIPMNRIGFRYIPAGVSSSEGILTCHTIESSPCCFRVSWEDRSPFVKVTKDGLGLMGDKGFRSARCNTPIREGRWYMEVRVEHGGGERPVDSTKPEGSHVRLGWGRREAPLNGPVGLDGYSYGMRDKTGEKVTLSRPRPYGRPFSSGDVIGMYISLPPRRQPIKNDPYDPAHVKRRRIAIDLRGQEYFEVLEYPQSKEMMALMDYSGKSTNVTSVPSSSKKSATVKNVPERGRAKPPQTEAAAVRPIPILPNSLIAFFINGVCQGIAFQDIYDYLPLRSLDTSRKVKEKKRTREGAHEHKENPYDDGQLGYYPFISLFNDACVRINPGPEFAFPPPPNIDSILTGQSSDQDSKERTWRPICERYAEYMQDEWALDAIDIEAAKAEAARRAALDTAEAERKALRQQKRVQVEARKRAKAAQIETTSLATDDDRFGPATMLNLPGAGQPSPLRNSVAYETEGIDHMDSPAQTVISTADYHGTPSGYNSEYADGDDLADNFQIEQQRDSSPFFPDSGQTVLDGIRNSVPMEE